MSDRISIWDTFDCTFWHIVLYDFHHTCGCAQNPMSLRRLVQTDSYTSGYLHQRYFQEFWQGQIVVIMDKRLTKFRFWLCFLQVSLSLSIFLVIQETGELENKAFYLQSIWNSCTQGTPCSHCGGSVRRRNSSLDQKEPKYKQCSALFIRNTVSHTYISVMGKTSVLCHFVIQFDHKMTHFQRLLIYV